MKKIIEIKSEISDIKHKIEGGVLPSEEKRLRKKIPFFKKCILYLETEPDENFCKNEVDRVCKMINKRMELFKPINEEKLAKKDLAKAKKDHEKEWDIPKMRMQLKTLNYLLK
jgi:hypothetical protein